MRARGRGRGLLTSRGRGFSASSANQHTSRAVVDNRPKQILVTAYDEKDKDAVVAQFAVSMRRLSSNHCFDLFSLFTKKYNEDFVA